MWILYKAFQESSVKDFSYIAPRVSIAQKDARNAATNLLAATIAAGNAAARTRLSCGGGLSDGRRSH